MREGAGWPDEGTKPQQYGSEMVSAEQRKVETKQRMATEKWLQPGNSLSRRNEKNDGDKDFCKISALSIAETQ